MAVRRDTAALPGSYRGAPSRAGGTGSGAGPSHNTHTAPVRRKGMRFGGNGSTWSPTVAYLVLLIAIEVAAYCTLRWAFRTAHGG